MSPKSLFFGLVIVGLPFAVVTGWSLGAPAAQPGTGSVAGEPFGFGALGAAPATIMPTDDDPGYTARPPRTTAAPATSVTVSAVPVSPAATITVTVVSSVPPLVVASSRPPLLTNPPVPTPTQIDDPPSPSATSSESASPSPSATPSSSLAASGS